MNRFECIKAECEDTCCKDWYIYIDEDNYQALERRMSTTKIDKDKFQVSVSRIRNLENPKQYALNCYQLYLVQR